MERQSVSARVNLALKRRELISSIALFPSRQPEQKHKRTTFSYGKPVLLVKSESFINEDQDVSELRERFAQSRIVLRERLAKQFAIDSDCGCEE